MTASPFDQRLQRFVQAFLARIESETDTPEAFFLARWLATYLWKNTAGVYRLDALEDALARRIPPLHLPSHQPSADELHVASEVYAYGGHTALMRQLMLSSSSQADALLVHMRNAELAATRLNTPSSSVHVLPPGEDPSDRVIAIADRMQQYKRVVLHIHPNDVETAVAARLIRTYAPHVHIYFLNHSDHSFSVGVGAAHHPLEISHYGWMLRGKRGTTETSSFIGIPIVPPELRPAPPSVQRTVQLLTGGAAFKYRPQAGHSLPCVLRQILSQRPQYRVTVVGPNSRNWWWWPLRLRFPRRVKVCKLLPKDIYNQLLQQCTVYIDSYPIPGGTAFPEALMRGSKVAGIRGLVWGYSPTDELLGDDALDLLLRCDALAQRDHDALEAQQIVRLRCIDLHAPSSVRARFDQLAQSGIPTAPPKSDAPAPSASRLESAWLMAGDIYVPTRKECPLSASSRRWLVSQYLALHGPANTGTWRLVRYALQATLQQ